MMNRLASIWASTEDLTGKLAISIMKAKTEIKRPGWQRAVDFDEASLRREIMELKNENEQLKNDLQIARDEISSLTEQTDVAFEDQEIKIEYYYKNRGQNYKNHDSRSATLKEIFKVISIEMLDISISESRIKDVIENKFLPDGYERDFDDQQLIKKLLNQYQRKYIYY